ncbi:MAG: EscR/YscR/HrcR family type III secretion system export apparatus protein [Deltaproteobacteria bacterium]|nr:EscR/YscR/HrcR family type III secretion system export apparatus protein [Deltaproteobacteria bacterium]
MLTCFVKVSVVLSLLRNAIGATDAPSGLVVMGISLVLTLFVMAPIAVEMVQAAATTPAPGMPPPKPPAPNAPAPNAPAPGTPALTTPAVPSSQPVALSFDAALRKIVPVERHGELAAFERALVPLRGFLARHAAERERATFVELAARMGHPVGGDELSVLAPAFLTTELKEAFAIAVLIFIPFLVIDLIVGLGLAALGLTSSNPQIVALPLKLLLFVAVDGWRLLIDSLLRGYV